ncbi:MAG TPA: hypothetical protein PKN96_06555 [Flavobacterium sp.]|uniref:hypothetical protein n=1 Tax=Flavobacterium sp. TaxID=239 RepID=UPI002C1A12CA|nr:hypothetical protein [Flavobacterium sp.]HNP32935.1 hypothetical protein [Flavobacterium sp.]
MAKIRYLLGAGASYYACPILERQAEMMVEVARQEIQRLYILKERDGVWKNYDFIDKKYLSLSDKNEYKILWWIGYFGEKAKEYNTIDTYARKLYLNDEKLEYKYLKMSVSIFFDLWENFYSKDFKLHEDLNYSKIDNRYKSLFSILLNNLKGEIKLNHDFKFISWNYDLQLEECFKMFLGKDSVNHYDNVNRLFKFKQNQNDNVTNDVFHLNGHRGFFKDKSKTNDEHEQLLNDSILRDDYWKNLTSVTHLSASQGKVDFNDYIKYAWEHDFNDIFFQKIANTMRTTEILVIIGYSFPAFNREIDQFLFSKLNHSILKKIIYQDPNATKSMIENLFERPLDIRNKIEIINGPRELKQFYLPNEFFISQQNNFTF